MVRGVFAPVVTKSILLELKVIDLHSSYMIAHLELCKSSHTLTHQQIFVAQDLYLPVLDANYYSRYMNIFLVHHAVAA